MKSDKLFDAIGELPDEYVQDARPATVLKRKVPWGVWAAAAACLVIAVLIAVPLLNDGANNAAETRDAVISDGVEDTEEKSAEEKNAETTSGSSAPEAANPEETVSEGAEDSAIPTSDTLFEPNAGMATEEEFEEYNLALNTSMFGGVYTYDMYVEGYERATENPVFDALLNSHGTERFFASSPDADNFTQWAKIYVDGISTVGKSLAVRVEHSDVEHSDEYYEREWEYFEGTGDREIEVTEYEVDGIAIQKYLYPNTNTYYARINIDGEWYLVTGVDEAAVDETMAELARIANQL